MTRCLLLCALVAGCAQASTAPPDAEPGTVVPDAEVGTIPDADTSPDADPCVPTTEECDGDDDDCDDVADNGCACTPNDSTQMCFTANPTLIGIGECVQGTQTCIDGAWSASCAGEVTPTTETCDGEDDDCDGTPDDGNPGGGACTTGMSGICSAGTRTCSGGVLSGCVANMSPGLEVCDGLDNDCNTGTLDGNAETWFGDACDGADADSCGEGIYSCNGSGQACSDNTGDSNRVVDGGYEAGSPWPAWGQGSTNFGSPICDEDCTLVPNNQARTGSYWNWLGGFNGAEVAFTSQAMTIPVGTATLTFYLRIPACAVGGAADTFVVSVDGTTVFSTTSTDAACNGATYVQKSANVSAFANGASHTIEFRGTFVTGHTSGLTNFFVDDIRLESCP